MSVHLIESVSDQTFYLTDSGAAYKAYADGALQSDPIIVKRWDNTSGWVSVIILGRDEAADHNEAVLLATTILGEG